MNVLQAMRDTIALGHKGKMPDVGPLGYPHIAGMYQQAAEGQFSNEKLNRWLGWMQCAVVAAGCASLSDMKAINLRNSDDV